MIRVEPHIVKRDSTFRELNVLNLPKITLLWYLNTPDWSTIIMDKIIRDCEVLCNE